MSNTNYIPVKSSINWDEYFMMQALIASYRSKDPSTKVGSVFVDHRNHQISMGYNGFIAGIDEKQLPWGKIKDLPYEEQKYAYVVHSEANAILHATGSLENSKCYVTLFPCHECAKLLATVKIKEVIYLHRKEGTESDRISQKIFDLSKITYRPLSIDEATIKPFFDYIEKMTLENYTHSEK